MRRSNGRTGSHLSGIASAIRVSQSRSLGRGPALVVGGRPDDQGTSHLATGNALPRGRQIDLPNPAFTGPLRPSIIQSRMVGHAGSCSPGMPTSGHDAVGIRPSGIRALRLAGESSGQGQGPAHEADPVPHCRWQSTRGDSFGTPRRQTAGCPGVPAERWCRGGRRESQFRRRGIW